MSEVVIGGCLGHSNPKATQFKFSVGRRKSAIKTSHLVMRRAKFKLLRELVSMVPCENCFEGAGVHQCCPDFQEG